MRPLAPKIVQVAGNLARVSAELRQVALELIDLLDHVDRDHHLVVVEVKEGPRVVQEHVGVEDEVLAHSGDWVIAENPRP